MTHRHKTGH